MTARRCAVPAHLKAAHNATRMMTRIATLLQTPLDDTRRTSLRDAFQRHCNRLRDAKGMGDGVFPAVPTSVSLVSEYSPQRLDQLPYEVVEARSEEAAENGDWMACEVLALELDRRDDLAARYPDAMDAEEQRRRAQLDAETRREMYAQLDPITHPGARQPLSAKEAVRAQRAEYEEWVELEVLRAEEATRGNLFNRQGVNARLQGKGCTPRVLWTNHIFADAYASEELRRYWTEHPRLTFGAWQEMAAGRTGAARENVSKSDLINF